MKDNKRNSLNLVQKKAGIFFLTYIIYSILIISKQFSSSDACGKLFAYRNR